MQDAKERLAEVYSVYIEAKSDDGNAAGKPLSRDQGARDPLDVDDLPMEPMVLKMGPSHPTMHGVIELTLRLDGETVRAVDVEIGYLHRGFEKMAENSAWNQVFAYADRLNYNSAMLNELGYAMAVEKLMGVDVPERAQFLRVVAGEVSRICDHLTCVGAGAMELGAFTAFLYAVKAREYLYELLEKISGHRLTVNYMRVGGVWQDMPDGWDAALRQGLTDAAAVMREFHKLVTRHRIFFDRMEGVGIISQEDALAWGFTGPCLRSTGIDYDIRKAHPYSCYDRFDFDVPVGDKGDNYDRYLIRLEEIEQSRRIIEQALERMPDGPVVSSDPRVALPEKGNVYNTIESMMNHFKLVYDGIRVPPGSVYSFSEVANGELGFLIVADGSGKPYRVRVRGPVFAIMQALPQMLIGGLIADIVPTFDGINMIAGELDR